MPSPPIRINAQELCNDLRKGVDAPTLRAKYGLSPQQLPRAFSKLVETGTIAQSDLATWQIRDRAIRLFKFLRELRKLGIPSIKISDSYEKVLWLWRFPKAGECRFTMGHRDEDDESAQSLLEIDKPKLKPPPDIPEEVRSWVELSTFRDSSCERPGLLKQILVRAPDPTENGKYRDERWELSKSPEVEVSWNKYIEQYWSKWADEDRRLRKIQDWYSQLHSIYQKVQQQGELYELILGLGYLTWKPEIGLPVKRHIVTTQLQIAFDSGIGRISVGFADDGAKLSLEQDMLETQVWPKVKDLDIEAELVKIGDNILSSPELKNVLRSWTNSLSNEGHFVDDMKPQEGAALSPQMNFAPAIILRKRTDSGFPRVFQKIADRLGNGGTIPPGIQRVVMERNEQVLERQLQANDKADVKGIASQLEEIYFPLPFNQEQMDIARKLSSNQGVLVQGPPGTGKSQTIANLVCHLVAHGQRVLVTSHASRALRVLRDFFKKAGIDELTLSLLEDRSSDKIQELEQSVQLLVSKFDDPMWREQNRLAIGDLEKKIQDWRRQEQTIHEKLRSVRERETFRHHDKFGMYSGTAQEIASRVRDDVFRFSWIGFTPQENQEPPLSDQESLELRVLLRETAVAPERAGEFPLNPTDMLHPSEFEEIVMQYEAALRRHQTFSNLKQHPSYAVLVRQPMATLESLESTVNSLQTGRDHLDRSVHNWLAPVCAQVLGGQTRRWKDLLNLTTGHLQIVSRVMHEVEDIEIEGLRDHNLKVVRTHAEDLLNHLQSGRSLGFLGRFFRRAPVKNADYLVKTVRVDGLLCKQPHVLERLLQWIEVELRLDSLRSAWAEITTAPSGSLSTRFAEYHDLSLALGKALELTKMIDEFRQVVSDAHRILEPTWNDRNNVRDFIELVQAAKGAKLLEQAERPLREFEARVRNIALGKPADEVTKEALGAIRNRHPKSYANCYKEIVSLFEFNAKKQRLLALQDRLRQAAPSIDDELRNSWAESHWAERLTNFTAAWNWARAENWLIELSDPDAEMGWMQELERCRENLLSNSGELAKALAWDRCLNRMTHSEKEHLVAYLLAVKSLGKGKGPNAPLFRKTAREEMKYCRRAIPSWIMPIYRVAEIVEPEEDSFDVVIMDEASQSGPEAILLEFLARKIVVVGDDKQISPQSFVAAADLAALQGDFLHDIPYKQVVGGDYSFFDQAMIRYTAPIQLREHFRCMPEIIQFSNNLCYRGNSLIPLRQYGAGRLEPVIAVHYVEGGYAEGDGPKQINRVEAEAIVQSIKQCCQDSQYDGKTMGVITLLTSEAQTQYIETLLRKELDSNEMEKRRLICGNAYAFQGDERHIVFLSMVSANNKKFGALADGKAKRRFNVAMSRAKDQVRLFHSVTLDSLSETCYRRKLLEYCLNPKVETSDPPTNFQALREDANSPQRRKFSPDPRFDSWFEVDVYLKIVARGYRVLPQFEVANYKIDLVVEGLKGRLAVECYGDRWHGPERYEHDMFRLRVLQRCGWTFWTVYGSSFYRNPDGAMNDLWELLDRLKIYPSVADSRRTTYIPPELDLSVPVLLLIDSHGGSLGGEGPWDNLPHFLSYADKEPVDESVQAMDFQARLNWTLEMLLEKTLLARSESGDWRITQRGQRELSNRALV